jgi:hypothetical protein
MDSGRRLVLKTGVGAPTFCANTIEGSFAKTVCYSIPSPLILYSKRMDLDGVIFVMM